MTSERPHPSGCIESYRLDDDGRIPNNPALPLLVYRAAVPADRDAAALFEMRFAEYGWRGAWRNGVYDYHHFHSTAHEVLGIARGEARIRFGGENGPCIRVGAGDAVVVPAGVGHKNEGASDDLLVVGAYPAGQKPDLCTGAAGERPGVLDAIRRVALPAADPIYGDEGPLRAYWAGASGRVG